MKTISHINTSTQKDFGKFWSGIIHSIERRLMQRNQGRTALTRQLRCRTKLLVIKLIEKTY